MESIEDHFRSGEVLDPASALVVRGWPLTVDGLLSNANAARRRYSFGGRPFVAISAEITSESWGVDDILSGTRLRTRRSYASAAVGDVVEAGFDLLPTFSAPHYSIVLGDYTEDEVQRLISVLGQVVVNPYFVRREL